MLREIARLQSGSRNTHQYTYPKNWLANPPQQRSEASNGLIACWKLNFLNQPGVGAAVKGGDRS